MIPGTIDVGCRRRSHRHRLRSRLPETDRSAPAGLGREKRLGDEVVRTATCRSRSPSPGRPARNSAEPRADSQSSPPRVGPRPSFAQYRWPVASGPSRSSNCWNFSRSSAASIVSTLVPMIGTPAVFKRPGQIQRRLSAELHDHAVRLDAIADVQHVFDGERLEEQQVARVVVGADRLRVAS